MGGRKGQEKQPVGTGRESGVIWWVTRFEGFRAVMLIVRCWLWRNRSGSQVENSRGESWGDGEGTARTSSVLSYKMRAMVERVPRFATSSVIWGQYAISK